MKNFNYIKAFSFTRVSLVIITVCSVVTFYGVFKILKMHQRTITVGANTDMNMVRIIKDLEGDDANCQDRLKIIELENKIMREQLDTLFEFHEHEKAKAKIKHID